VPHEVLLYRDKSTLMCYCILITGTSLVSLYELLNQCKTAAGSATLRNWLLRPLRDVAVIQRRQGTVQALVSQPQVLVGLRESRKAGLKAFPDISQLGMSSCANPKCLFNAVLLFPILYVDHCFSTRHETVAQPRGGTSAGSADPVSSCAALGAPG
jgi:hypothetical protein